MVEEVQKKKEGILATFMLLAPLAIIPGVVMVFRPDLLKYDHIGPYLIATGVISIAVSYLLSFDMGQMRMISGGSEGRSRYAQLRRWTRIKIAVLFLSLMILLGLIVLALAVLSRVGVVSISLEGGVMQRLLSLLLLAMVLAQGFAHFQSLRVTYEHDRSGPRRAYNIVGAGVSIAIAGFAVAVAYQGGIGPFEGYDAPFVFLLALTLLALVCFVARTLPTPYDIFNNREFQLRTVGHFSASKNVVLPTMVAFGLLFGLLLLFLVVGASSADRISDLATSRVTVIAILFLGLALTLSLVASVFLARQEDKPVLYKRTKSQQEKTEMWVMVMSITLGSLMFLWAAVLGLDRPLMGVPRRAWVEVLTVGILLIVGPIGFYAAHVARHRKLLEDRFPDFLRDMASSHRGGLTMPAAVFVAAKGDYGELTQEVHKMADQLSWNVPFEEALERFADRVRTPLVERSVSLILEASRSGGSTTDVLLAAGRDARELKTLEGQRSLSMTLYTSVIYITFFVFLVVVGILNSQFVPEILAANEAARSQGATSVGGLSFETPTAHQFRTFYFLAAVMQGVGDGVVAGMMSTGRLALGLRHSFIMVLVSFLAFTLWLN